MELPEKNWESLMPTIKMIKDLKGPQKWNSRKELDYLKIIDTWVESDFDLDQTYQVTVDYINKHLIK